MPVKGRYLDNVFGEHLRRNVKYKDVYVFGYDSNPNGQTRLAAYFGFYNHRRPHSSLVGLKPAQAYAARLAARHLAVNLSHCHRVLAGSCGNLKLLSSEPAKASLLHSTPIT